MSQMDVHWTPGELPRGVVAYRKYLSKVLFSVSVLKVKRPKDNTICDRFPRLDARRVTDPEEGRTSASGEESGREAELRTSPTATGNKHRITFLSV